MWVEVVASLKVRRDQEDDLGIGEIRRRAIEAHPRLVANAGIRRANVGVRVVPINTPGREHALGVAIFSWTADVIHDLIAAAFGDGSANSTSDFAQRVIPTDAFPLS